MCGRTIVGLPLGCLETELWLFRANERGRRSHVTEHLCFRERLKVAMCQNVRLSRG